MTDYIVLVLLFSITAVHQVSGSVYGFDNSVCLYHNTSEGGPMPQWAFSYSANVEWKVMDRNITVSVEEYWDKIDQIRSITASIEGTTIQNIFNDAIQEIYTIKDNQCTRQDLITEIFFFDNTYGLHWVTMTKDWYKVMLQNNPIQKPSTTIRSTNVDHWSTCLYIVNFDVTAHIDMYFASNWALPQVDPTTIIPIRIEVRGKFNGTDSTAFHVIGDFFNFNPTPAFDPQKLQPPPGVFCPGKDPGKPIIPLPTSFYGIIEIVDRIQTTITFREIWFHSDKKMVRFDTKDSDGSDSDPYRTILDFNTGVAYKIDKYIGSCETDLVAVGQYFVKGTGTSVDIVTVAEFFHLGNAEVQYVGKRYTRGILCDVWVGNYFDDSVSKNFTAEWYFSTDGWKEAVGLVINIGSFIRMDVFGGAQYPLTHHIHRMDPSTPPLSSFDLSNCYKPSEKAHFIIRFSVSQKNVIPQISQLYLRDILQQKLTETANVESTRLTDVYTEYDGEYEFYLRATLLEKAPQTNPFLATPPLQQISLEGAYGFIRGQIEGHWSQNISTSTGQNVVFTGVNIVRLKFQEELTTTTAQTTPTLPYIIPTLPGPTKPPTPKVPTPKPLPTTTSSTPSTKKVITTPQPGTSTSRTTKTANMPKSSSCVCPKVTCPALTTATPKVTPKVTCPTLKHPTPAVQTKQTNTPHSTTSKPLLTTKPPPDCSALRSQLQQASKNKSSGISGGGAAGIAIGMLLVGAIFGVLGTILYNKKRTIRDDQIALREY